MSGVSNCDGACKTSFMRRRKFHRAWRDMEKVLVLGKGDEGP